MAAVPPVLQDKRGPGHLRRNSSSVPSPPASFSRPMSIGSPEAASSRTDTPADGARGPCPQTAENADNQRAARAHLACNFIQIGR